MRTACGCRSSIGIAPIPSAKSARWMREKLFGTRIPDSIVERLEKARGREGRGPEDLRRAAAGAGGDSGRGRRARDGADEFRGDPGRDRAVWRAAQEAARSA